MHENDIRRAEQQAARAVSDKMLAALRVCQVPMAERDPWDVIECLSQKEGIPYKVAWRRLEKAAERGYIEYGVSVSGAWLTPEGKAALEAARAKIEFPCPS